MWIKREIDDKTAQFLDDIVRRRKEKGWSQERLARRVGIPRTSLRRLELKENEPIMSTALRLATVLNLPISDYI
jgi:transcriptional regulator with XRE-family HTH domain